MLKTLNQNRLFFGVFLVVFILSLLKLNFQAHGEALVWINKFARPDLDVFFQWITFIGDGGVIVAAILLLFLFVRMKYGLALLFSFMTSGLFTQLIKRTIESPRPKRFFANFMEFNLIEGYAYVSNLSFPSGHTSTVFAMCTLLALYSKNNLVKFALLITAILVGVSRMYLLQHFLLDVTVGALIGIFFGALSYQVFEKYSKDIFEKSAFSWFKNRKTEA